MSEWLENQKKPSSNFRQLLHEHIEKANPRHKLIVEKAKRLAKLETNLDVLKTCKTVSYKRG